MRFEFPSPSVVRSKFGMRVSFSHNKIFLKSDFSSTIDAQSSSPPRRKKPALEEHLVLLLVREGHRVALRNSTTK